MIQKTDIRKSYKNLRDSLSKLRRMEASKLASKELSKLNGRHILSFCSFGSEIDLVPLNTILASEGRLVLPRRSGDDLELYIVKDLSNDLYENANGLKEPIPEKCQRISAKMIDLALVPGVAFDNTHYRLGLGKGFYDRFLSSIKIQTIGIGFSEQLSPDSLNLDPWDIPLDSLRLF